jgi:hypothetical protein
MRRGSGIGSRHRRSRRIRGWVNCKGSMRGRSSSELGRVAEEGEQVLTHQLAIVAMGLPLIDVMDLEAVAQVAARLKRWEFLLTAEAQQRALIGDVSWMFEAASDCIGGGSSYFSAKRVQVVGGALPTYKTRRVVDTCATIPRCHLRIGT